MPRFPARSATAQPAGAFSFGPGVLDAAAGIYRACWCRGACEGPGAFFVELGLLTVSGPSGTHLE